MGICLDATAKGVLAASKVRSLSPGDIGELEPALSPAGLSPEPTNCKCGLSRSADTRAPRSPGTVRGDADLKDPLGAGKGHNQALRV